MQGKQEFEATDDGWLFGQFYKAGARAQFHPRQVELVPWWRPVAAVATPVAPPASRSRRRADD